MLVASMANQSTAELDQASLRALQPVFGELAKQSTTCLINRATCAIRLGRLLQALDDSWAAIESCFTPRQPGSPPWQRSLESSSGWEWRRGGYLKAVLRRAEAAEALGVPMLPFSHMVWASRHVSSNGFGAATTLVLTEVKARYDRLVRTTSLAIKPPPGAALNEGLVPASWSKMKLRPGAIAPAARFGGASAVVGDALYLFGGTADEDRKMGDAWRLSLSSLTSAQGAAQLPAWELLPVPARHGGPSAGRPPCGAACEELQLFVVLAGGVLWTLAAGAGSDGRAWANLRCPTSPAFAENGEDAALTVAGTTAFVFHAPEGLFRICLRTGQSALVPITGSSDCFNRPRPLLWPAPGCGAAPGEPPRLRVWSGDDALDGEGVGEQYPPMSEDMWCFEGTEWRVAVPGGGGGAVPPRRTEAALAPLPGWRAVLMGGFTDRMGNMVTGEHPVTGEKVMLLSAARVMDDSYLWDSQAGGWRVLRCGGEQPPPAAFACLAHHAASGMLLTFGGWGDAPTQKNVNYTFPLSDVYILRIDALMAAVSPAEDEPRCAHCSRTSAEAAAAGGKLMRCARCWRVFYCGKVCQQASWPAHRADCKAI